MVKKWGEGLGLGQKGGGKSKETKNNNNNRWTKRIIKVVVMYLIPSSDTNNSLMRALKSSGKNWGTKLSILGGLRN